MTRRTAPNPGLRRPTARWALRTALAGALALAAAQIVAGHTAAGQTAAGQTAPGPAPDPAAAEAVAANLPDTTLRAIGSSPKRYVDGLLYRLRKIGTDGAVTQADLARDAQERRAVERARQMEHLLAHDLDGDGRVTRAEYDATSPPEGTRSRWSFEKFAGVADADGDGTISARELYAYADGIAGRRANVGNGGAEPYGFLQFDVDGDGAVTEAEITAVVDAVVRKLARLNRTPSVRAGCALPVPPAEAQVVLLSGYGGAGLSTVAADGMDRLTTVATVTIEDGEQPLYIVATAYDQMIWKIDGAVGRVVRFVVQPPVASLGPGAGVVGLPPDVVRFVAPNACMKYFSKPDDGKARRAAQDMGKRLGREPASLTVVGIYTLHDVHIPSGKARRPPGGSYLGITFKVPEKEKAEPPQRSFPAPDGDSGGARLPESGGGLPNTRKPSAERVQVDEKDILPDTQGEEVAELNKAMLKRHPAGLVEIDPAAVVAPGEVPAYDVLPAQAGFIQLIESGAVRKTSEKTYVVLREIPRLPAGWTAHSDPYRRIIFGKGIDEPGGKSGSPALRRGN